MWAEVAGKRLELLLELVPKAKSIAYLHNPTNPVFAESEARELQAAARARAVRLVFVNASRPSEFEAAFADLVQQRADALVVSSAVSLLTDPDQIVALAYLRCRRVDRRGGSLRLVATASISFRQRSRLREPRGALPARGPLARAAIHQRGSPCVILVWLEAL